LTALKLRKYISAFIENELSDDALPMLSDDVLKEMGLPIGARLRIMSHIASSKPLTQPTNAPEEPISISTPLVEPIKHRDASSPTKLDRKAKGSDPSKAQNTDQNAAINTPKSSASNSPIDKIDSQAPTTTASAPSGPPTRRQKFVYVVTWPFRMLYHVLKWSILGPFLLIDFIVRKTIIGIKYTAPVWAMLLITSPATVFLVRENTRDVRSGMGFDLFYLGITLAFFLSIVALIGLLEYQYVMWLDGKSLFDQTPPSTSTQAALSSMTKQKSE
jgi:hypothetical protein